METLQERAGDKENSYHWIESSKHDIMIPTLKTVLTLWFDRCYAAFVTPLVVKTLTLKCNHIYSRKVAASSFIVFNVRLLGATQGLPA